MLLPLPWYLHNQSERGNAIFGRGMSLTTFQTQWPVEFYIDSGLPDVIVHPKRAELGVSIAPILYADTLGRLLRDLVLGRRAVAS